MQREGMKRSCAACCMRPTIGQFQIWARAPHSAHGRCKPFAPVLHSPRLGARTRSRWAMMDLPTPAALFDKHGRIMMTSAQNESQALGDLAARQLANATKTVPQLSTITPRWLLHLLSWVPVEAGLYRVNRVVNPEQVAIKAEAGAGTEEPLPETYVDYETRRNTRCGLFRPWSTSTPGSRTCTRARTTRSPSSCG